MHFWWYWKIDSWRRLRRLQHYLKFGNPIIVIAIDQIQFLNFQRNKHGSRTESTLMVDFEEHFENEVVIMMNQRESGLGRISFLLHSFYTFPKEQAWNWTREGTSSGLESELITISFSISFLFIPTHKTFLVPCSSLSLITSKHAHMRSFGRKMSSCNIHSIIFHFRCYLLGEWIRENALPSTSSFHHIVSMLKSVIYYVRQEHHEHTNYHHLASTLQYPFSRSLSLSNPRRQLQPMKILIECKEWILDEWNFKQLVQY